MFFQKIQVQQKGILWVVAGFIAAYAIYFITRAIAPQAFKTITIFIFSASLFYLAGLKQKYLLPVNKLLSGISLFLAIHLLYVLAKTYLHIPEWDFLCFYLFGKTGISTTDFYNPQVFAKVFNELNLQPLTSKDFTAEIVNVGFWYPPHSMLLFLMLGLFDLKTGYAVWQTVILVFIVADVFLLHKKYYQQLVANQKNKLIVFPVLLIILLFPNIEGSAYFSQTISVFLFFLLLIINNTDNRKAGIYLALLITIKPLAVFFIPYFLFTKKWKTLFALVLSGAVVLIISLLFFGYQPFLNYLTSPPTSRMPAGVFYEDLNQSLNAVLIRLGNKGFSFFNIKAVGYAISIAIVAVTVFSSRRLAKVSPALSFMVYIPMALIIYPGSLISYSILLLPVILYLYHQKPFNSGILNLVFVFFLYVIGLYSFFLLNLILWSILINYFTLMRCSKSVRFA
jgi:Glycosyltransferase family 87